jgi:Ser/Thr protein kinase RdoA (MazF antagonist)
MSDVHTEAHFNDLIPDVVINVVEEVLGERCTNICRPLNSYINRVYEIGLERGDAVIAKFYRPGRWSREALEDELVFLRELAEEEIPVVAPIQGQGESLLHECDGMYFSVFPKKGGRICDEPDTDQWRELGRLLGRVHVVGSRECACERIIMDPRESTTSQLAYILESGMVPPDAEKEYRRVAYETLDMVAPLFKDVERIRIHGDLHFQNLIYRPGESFYIIDFDDMAMGPPVQDIWMLLPGRVPDALREVDLFLEGYETFRSFDAATINLVEPLRAMRYIHFTAWCVRQAADGGFARLAPGWGTSSYWKQESQELLKQQAEIQDAMDKVYF